MGSKHHILKDKFIKEQERVLRIIISRARNFALAGGTALSKFYFNHRLSYDLDLFAVDFRPDEVASAIEGIAEVYPERPNSQGVATSSDSARIHQFLLPLHISPEFDQLKLDFVEDVYPGPKIRQIQGVPVYSEESLYVRKIYALTGSRSRTTEIGAEVPAGRRVARDLVDIYFLSKRIRPIHEFILDGLEKNIFDPDLPRRLVIWSKRFGRENFLHEYIDMDMYDRPDPRIDIFRHVDDEMKRLLEKVI